MSNLRGITRNFHLKKKFNTEKLLGSSNGVRGSRTANSLSVSRHPAKPNSRALEPADAATPGIPCRLLLHRTPLRLLPCSSIELSPACALLYTECRTPATSSFFFPSQVPNPRSEFAAPPNPAPAPRHYSNQQLRLPLPNSQSHIRIRYIEKFSGPPGKNSGSATPGEALRSSKMAKTLSHFNISFLFHLPKRIHSPISISFLISPLRKPKPVATASLLLSNAHPPNPTFSTTSTSYPLQYELIHHRPSQNPHHPHRRRLANSKPRAFPDSDSDPDPDPVEPDQSDLSFEDWVDKKLADNVAGRSTGREKSNTPDSTSVKMDKSKRKYYNKRRKRMYGSDSEDDSKANSGDGFVELKPEFVELRTLHKREEELYFYDTFAYPWEKGKHYKMVYQLEKKYFPDQCFDNAFLQPGEGNKVGISKGRLKRGMVTCNAVRGENREIVGEGEVDKGLIFFEDKNDGDGKDKNAKPEEVSEKKVEDFFKCLKKVPNNKNGDVSSSASSSSASDEPFLASRSNGLPPQWDTPTGTVVLINKPKGWTSFTVCGKLRRLVNVKKVGHAGTLDPMATGLLIVCVGKATKLVDRYQGMVKGYTGVFRLGEATSTWDADSPVIQRESWEHIKDGDIKKAAASFVGEIWQVPPMFSAIKVGGERMYEKARRGESIELSPRRISVFQFDIERSLEDRQNLIFRVICSKGTYIRSLCADLGKALGSCAHLTTLRRESIGEYKADDAFEFQELEEEVTKGYL